MLMLCIIFAALKRIWYFLKANLIKLSAKTQRRFIYK